MKQPPSSHGTMQDDGVRKPRVFRLIPLTVTMLSLLLVIKLNEVYLGSQHLRELYDVREASAENKKPEETTPKPEEPKEVGAAKPSEHGTEDQKVEAKKEDPATSELAASDKKEEAKHTEETPAEAHAKEAKADEEKHETKEAKKEDAKESGHGKEEGGHGEKDAKPPEEPKTYGAGKTTVKAIEAFKAKEAAQRFSKTEIDLLENLSKRRNELDERERELTIKSKVLEATEKRINDKITEMKGLEAELAKVVAQYNEKQDAQIKSLVKTYETMKPDEAAAIFNEMDMPILLDIVSKMSERKMALVLANMNPKKARDVTQELAEKRKKAARQAAEGGATVPAITSPPKQL